MPVCIPGGLAGGGPEEVALTPDEPGERGGGGPVRGGRGPVSRGGGPVRGGGRLVRRGGGAVGGGGGEVEATGPCPRHRRRAQRVPRAGAAPAATTGRRGQQL